MGIEVPATMDDPAPKVMDPPATSTGAWPDHPYDRDPEHRVASADVEQQQ